jgi:hypothetical protein
MGNLFGMTTDDGDVMRDERYVAFGALYMRERVVGGYPFGIFYYSREYGVKPEGGRGLVGAKEGSLPGCGALWITRARGY